MQVEMSEREAAAVATALKESRYIFTNKAWVMEMIERLRKAAKTVACLAIVFAAANAEAATLQEVIARATSNLVARIAAASKTNAVDALASPENYALLKSTKLKDAAAKLALQKKLAEAALTDADANEKSRLKWHGAYSSQSVDLENLKATFYHADGYAVTVDFARPNLEAAARTANGKLVRLAETNGVPARLAAARARRNAEKSGVAVIVVSENANRREGDK